MQQPMDASTVQQWIGGLLLFGLILLGPTPAHAAQFRVCWQNPSENVDGTPLTDLAKVTIHWGGTSRSYADTIDFPTTIPGATNLCLDITEAAGDYFVAATATDGEDNESAFSNEVLKTATDPPVSPFILSAPTQPDAATHDVTLLVGETGKPLTIAWQGGSGTTEVELLAYGDTVPIATGNFTTSTEWIITPPRAGLYFSRLRSCDPGCGAWITSTELGFLYYFKLATPTGGGIE